MTGLISMLKFSQSLVPVCPGLRSNITCALVLALFYLMATSRQLNRAGSFEETEEFSDRCRDASAATMAGLLGTQRQQNNAIKHKKSPGPKRRTVKIKIYHLPDASEMPNFNCKPADPKIKQHMDHGYGE